MKLTFSSYAYLVEIETCGNVTHQTRVFNAPSASHTTFYLMGGRAIFPKLLHGGQL